MNNLTINHPEIKATIAMLRKKAGLDPDAETETYLKKEIKRLEKENDRLSSIINKRELTFQREFVRVQNFLRMLTTVRGKNLKKAVALVIYWDKFSWITCDIVDRMCERDARVKAFFDLPRQFGYITAMRACVGTKAFEEALKRFGYGESANERVRSRSKVKGKEKKEVEVEVS